MFEKLTSWFKTKSTIQTDNNNEAEEDKRNEDEQQQPAAPKSKPDFAPSSEFAIKYSGDKGFVPRLTPIGRELFAPGAKADVKLDTMAFIIHCKQHQNVAVYEDPSSNIRWLPFTPLYKGK